MSSLDAMLRKQLAARELDLDQEFAVQVCRLLRASVLLIEAGSDDHRDTLPYWTALHRTTKSGGILMLDVMGYDE